jgi:hypothetical protein
VRGVSNRASHPMAAEIDDVDVMFAAGCLDSRNVFVSPAPEFDLSKASCGDTRNFIFGQEAGIQRVEANGRCHEFSLSLNDGLERIKALKAIKVLVFIVRAHSPE